MRVRYYPPARHFDRAGPAHRRGTVHDKDPVSTMMSEDIDHHHILHANTRPSFMLMFLSSSKLCSYFSWLLLSQSAKGYRLSPVRQLQPQKNCHPIHQHRVHQSRTQRFLQDDDDEYDDDANIQWELFKKHHAKGSWKGVWTTYDYIGDVMDETVASVDLDYAQIGDTEQIQQTHQIVVGATRSDCATCFDRMEIKSIPVATYSPGKLKKTRLAACSMVNGPTVLRSGAMATELVLSHGDGRVRVLFQHAAVWERNVEPGSGPPQGLKLFRTMISREALRETAPTAETEARQAPMAAGNPIFFRSVPPYVL